MKTRHTFILLTCSLLLLSCEKMQTVDCEFLTLQIPAKWSVTIDEPLPRCSAVTMVESNKQDVAVKMAFVYCYDYAIDPATVLANITGSTSNVLFAGARVNEVKDEQFQGRAAKSITWSNNLSGVNYTGRAYAFAEGKSTYVCGQVVMSNDEQKPFSIWKSLVIKPHEIKEPAGLREELTQYIDGLKKAGIEGKQVAQGVYLKSMELLPDSDCVTYAYTLKNLDKSTLKADDLKKMENDTRVSVIESTKAVRDKDEMTRKCMDASYSFRYIYYDLNDRLLFTIEVTPQDYN